MLSHKWNAHYDLFLQWKSHFNWIDLSWSKIGRNWSKIGKKVTHFTLRSNFLKNCSVTFFLIAHMEGLSWPLSPVKTPFWLNRSNWVKLTYLSPTWPTFSYFARFLKKYLIDFLLFCSKWTTMTLCSICLNAILIELL